MSHITDSVAVICVLAGGATESKLYPADQVPHVIHVRKPAQRTGYYYSPGNEPDPLATADDTYTLHPRFQLTDGTLIYAQ